MNSRKFYGGLHWVKTVLTSAQRKQKWFAHKVEQICVKFAHLSWKRVWKRARTIKKSIQKKYLTNSLARGMWDLSWTKWQDFIKKSPLIGWFGKKKDSVLLPLEGGSTESRMAEKQGFEPWLRFSRTTPLAGEPLRPLGYFSVCRILIAFLMLDYDSTRVGQCQ